MNNSETGIDLLPLEVLNIITENQTLYVLSASSTVSVAWIGSFNQNWMWWQHCIAETAEYLDTAECRVEPRFESPENRNGLPPTGSTKYNNRELDTIRDNSPHCNSDTAEYLDTAECRLDPRFKSPESEDSTQTCLYKKAGIRKSL
ncbi:hypothetical protein J6590_083197 [Homalodisca vitripennis]|nr:hypothetical protein J6590_083197 [Homalodisca vitripennis]